MTSALPLPQPAAALPWLPAGTVYGTLLNFRREWDVWAQRMHDAPYQAPPQAPVLYVKTANTFAPEGARVAVPQPVWLGPSVGLVIGDFDSNNAAALAGRASSAMPNVASCVLLNDLSLPHDSYYRPAIRFRNRDGFLVCGAPVPRLSAAELAGLKVEARLNGEPVLTLDLATLVRSAATLLADVAQFMPLAPGDVLLLGTDSLADGSRPLARPGDRVEIRAPGFAPLVHTLVQDETP